MAGEAGPYGGRLLASEGGPFVRQRVVVLGGGGVRIGGMHRCATGPGA